MESEKFSLRWNDFKSNISEAFKDLREEKDFFDVTLACEDNQIQAHKVILSACSPFFRNILRRNPHQHPLLYLKDVKYKELLSVINFMYLGEVSIAQEELNSFLNVAEELRVKGLTQGTHEQQPSYNSKSNMDHSKNESSKSSNQHSIRERVPTFAEHPVKQSPQVFRQREENVAHEASFLKTEPRDQAQQRAPMRSYQGQAQDTKYVEEDHELVQGQLYDDETEQGTVALDDGYAVDTGYEDQYADQSYHVEGENFAYNHGQEVTQELNSVILSKMMRNEAGDWQCNECYKTSNKKQNIMEHIEASHMETPGYNCEVCYKIFKTKHSLRTHKNVKHREYKQ